MKREDVKNRIPGITEEQLDWLMTENGSDINREKSAAAALQTRLDSAQAQVTKLQADMEAQSDGFAFDNALNAAILGAKGRSVPAVRALLTAAPTAPSCFRLWAAVVAVARRTFRRVDVVRIHPWLRFVRF